MKAPFYLKINDVLRVCGFLSKIAEKGGFAETDIMT